MKLRYNDKAHGYWLDGKRCKSVSTVAKIPDDTFSLEQWRKRMVAIGVANDPAIVAAVLANEQNHAVLNELAEQAMSQAGAHLAAEAGTRAHETTEAHDRGHDNVKDDGLVAGRWDVLLHHAGLEVIHDYIERGVVLTGPRICGRFDRYCRRKSDGRLATIDLKTGGSAVKYPHATACQLAMYAHADLLTGELVDVSKLPKDDPEYVYIGETTEFYPMPDLDQDVGYMLHIPDDGEPVVYAMNLKRGWETVQNIIIPTLDWRATPHDKIIRAI